MTQSPKGLGLLGYLNRVKAPVRLKDMAIHPESVGLPENHPPMTTFLGVPLYHRSEHVGNLYLAEKDGGKEFTGGDETVAAMLAAQAASIISNSRRYEESHQAKVELETLMDVSPVSVSVFDVRIGEMTYMNQEGRRILGLLGVLPKKRWKVSTSPCALPGLTGEKSLSWNFQAPGRFRLARL